MLTPNTILQNRYQILHRIGGGGMGDVYLAADLRLGNQRVVVKENRGGDPQLFYAEATLLATLRHPNLPRVNDHFVESGAAQNVSQYLVMDYVAGETLEQIVYTHGALVETQALAWFAQIMDAVKYLHANHIIHRDIKPQNIIIAPDGRAVLVDFGIAKVMRTGQVTASAARGFGSPGYAPPEQYTGGTDERSDIYSLGATMYFALSGIDPPSVPERASGKIVPSVRQSNASVSANADSVVHKAMALQMNQRYASIEKMERSLQARTAAVSKMWLAAAIASAGAIILLIIAVPALGFPSGGATQTPTRMAVGVLISPSIVPPTVALTHTPLVVTSTPVPTPSTTATPRATPTARAGEERLIGGAPMVFVPAGEFTMGSSEGESSNQPPHRVYVDAFWMDKYEMTNSLYKKCVDAGKCQPPDPRRSWRRDSYYGDASYNNYPVIYVSWNDADRYCKWSGKRLPTEAEWEKAARGIDDRELPWGNTWNGTQANVWDDSIPFRGDTTAVGAFPSGASPYGALDMAGNVYEWVADWYDLYYYSKSPRNNPRGGFADDRVARGGSWNNSLSDAATWRRSGGTPAEGYPKVGFRCAR